MRYFQRRFFGRHLTHSFSRATYPTQSSSLPDKGLRSSDRAFVRAAWGEEGVWAPRRLLRGGLLCSFRRPCLRFVGRMCCYGRSDRVFGLYPDILLLLIPARAMRTCFYQSSLATDRPAFPGRTLNQTPVLSDGRLQMFVMQIHSYLSKVKSISHQSYPLAARQQQIAGKTCIAGL
jgi:hypothetical protein